MRAQQGRLDGHWRPQESLGSARRGRRSAGHADDVLYTEGRSVGWLGFDHGRRAQAVELQLKTRAELRVERFSVQLRRGQERDARGQHVTHGRDVRVLQSRRVGIGGRVDPIVSPIGASEAVGTETLHHEGGLVPKHVRLDSLEPFPPPEEAAIVEHVL